MSSGSCPPPVFQLGRDDLAVIGTLLHPYETYVRRHFRPSFKRGVLLIAIETLRQRIVIAASHTEGSINLSIMDVEVISKALGLFIDHLPFQVRKSPQRDEVLASCKHLKAAFDAAFTTKPYFPSMQR